MRLFRIGKTWYIDYIHRGQRVRKTLRTRKHQIALELAAELQKDLALGRVPERKARRPLAGFIEDVYLKWASIHQKPSTFQETRLTLARFAAVTPEGARCALGELPLQASVRFLSEKEVDRLLAAAREIETEHGRYADLYPLIATAVYAGLRKAELGWLSWDDLDFDLGTLTVRGRRRAGDREVTTKNYQTRTLPLHPCLREILASRRRTRGYCFRPEVQPTAGRYRYEFSAGFAAVVERAGLADVTPHVLRPPSPPISSWPAWTCPP